MNKAFNLLKTEIKKVTGLGTVPGRYLTIFPDDVFLVSYPRSGNTWTIFLLGNYLFNTQINFYNYNKVFPSIYKFNAAQLSQMKRPRIIKSHEGLNKKYPKVIYLLRDPRDVCISYYFYQKKNKEITIPLETYVEKFIHGTNSPYGEWKKHVYGWINNRNKIKKGFMFFRYEDLKKNTSNELKKMIKFLGYEIDEKKINDAVVNSSFDSMRRLETKQEEEVSFLKKSDKEIKFIRSGKSDFMEYFKNFDTRIVEKFKTAFDESLLKLGYENDATW
ncbi:MAG: sulfotransferase domain-containing protein [Candidatus Aureabacteria bacterium]|nr:sulfotransferase domain-containing protein [Candidatus Auribacterota bacterium]